MNETHFKSLSVAYLRSLKVRNLSERTIDHVDWMLAKFLAYLEGCGVTHVEQIASQTIREYQMALFESLNSRGQPNSIAYQNRMLSAAKNFTRFLKDNDYIVSDPGGNVAYAKEPKKLPRGVLTPAEARRIIHAPDVKTVIGYRDRTILEVLYSSAIRKDELNKLTLADVDYRDGFLRIIEGKGKKDRIVPIGRIACRYLENYIKSVRGELIVDPYNAHLFLTMQGKTFSKNVVWKLVKKYAKKAKLKKNVHPHTFRHSCATAMLKNKADIRTIQKLLGHASLDSTQVYTHLSITDLKDIHRRCHPREREKM
ncbi:tyrosine recombinase XerD [Desulfosarcina alkanivorans]|uniref:Tyrosine recombinase XerD n=1 Tax=Desulfosarcina alkanivorans TaxID=571177 RepID=A0A5K7YQW6_9BACT|nr:tyrosine-type recombinase/integrase [Desulfosarcina alkanivorans]BBO72182.1 tyrosine recombinase XerD [Desulfosarcina alkanivorans]